MLDVVVIVVQVDVHQRQRPVAEDQGDTGENGSEPEHAAQSLPQSANGRLSVANPRGEDKINNA